MFCSRCLGKVSSCYDDDDDDDDDNHQVSSKEMDQKTITFPSSEEIIKRAQNQEFSIDTCGPLPPLDTTKWKQHIHISAHPVVKVNIDKKQPLPLATPIEFETKLFKGTAFFRLKDAPSPHDKVHNQYFHGRKRFYQVMIQGRFKEELNMKDILIGDYYSKPMENIPRGAIGSSFMGM